MGMFEEDILRDILKELKAINEKLDTMVSSGMCPHGTVGVCMDCIRNYAPEVGWHIGQAMKG